MIKNEGKMAYLSHFLLTFFELASKRLDNILILCYTTLIMKDKENRVLWQLNRFPRRNESFWEDYVNKRRESPGFINYH